MDNSLLAVRVINHKYIVVEKKGLFEILFQPGLFLMGARWINMRVFK